MSAWATGWSLTHVMGTIIMTEIIRTTLAAANDDTCHADLIGVPVVAAWGMGVDSTAMSVENRLAHIRAAVL